MGFALRVITSDDWEAFRAVRLMALANAPEAFGATLADATAQPPQVWRDRSAGAGPVILAFADDEPVAMGGLSVPPEGPTRSSGGCGWSRRPEVTAWPPASSTTS